MHLWILTNSYLPEGNAPATRLGGFAKLWAGQGRSVQEASATQKVASVAVLTSLPGQDKGVLYEGYHAKKLPPEKRQEVIDGVVVHRFPHYVTPKKNALPRLLQQLAFTGKVLWANLFSPKPKNRPDVILASSPDFFPAFAAWLLAVRFRAKFVLEVRDLWPGIFKEMGVLTNKPLLWILERLERCIYKKAHAIVTVSEGFRENIMQRGIPADKIFVVTNGLPDDALAAATNPASQAAAQGVRQQLGIAPETKLVAYIGNHGKAQALGQVVDAARLLHKRTDIQFVLVGAGAEKGLVEDMAQLTNNVRCLPNQPKAHILPFYQAADINLVTHKNVRVFNSTIPSKLFECLAVGKPVIGALAGEAAKILQKAGQICTPREEPEKLAAAILKLVDEPVETRALRGQQGQEAVKGYLHSTLVSQYAAVFRYVAS